jgi:hypothetical protein
VWWVAYQLDNSESLAVFEVVAVMTKRSVIVLNVISGVELL